ncbi:PGF-pre-PGF domain-containing protein [Methanolobus sp.]|uniref:PGF-pre-PGF domain-containing protein n=1 Tax=Methanolobus sp. TaxID=1874737 RepID=UPI0025EC80FE|nr:PGF-pre-PGF domain-containing protein [Methanolobus sp.]
MSSIASADDTIITVDDDGAADNISQVLTAKINYISPHDFPQGTKVRFSGTGNASYGEIVGYKWTSCRNGVLSSSDSFSLNTSNLKIGGHTISFSVKGDQGEWSEVAIGYIHVLVAPSATITSISPNPATEGTEVTFVGNAIDQDGTIKAYSWKIDGNQISNQATFTNSDISVGDHTVAFSAMDNNSLWSEEVTKTLKITEVQNIAPVTNIVSISPNPATEGTEVTFTGNATDQDGTIAAYLWTVDGNTVSTNETFTNSDIPIGEHTVVFSAMDNDNEWSEEVNTILTVTETPNIKPVTHIVSISPNPAYEGTEVTFTGNATDQDGTIAAYLWTVDGNTVSTNETFTNSDIPIGEHTVVFSAMDNDNEWSEEVNTILAVTETPNIKPVTNIVSISPNPATEGTEVTFSGSGNDTDGTIAAYNWTSSIDGNLSNSASFSTADLTVGTHTIYFSVCDNNGEWSSKVSKSLTVNKAPVQKGDDSASAVFVSVSPASGSTLAAGTSSANIIFNYNDTETGVNTDSVVFIFDYVDVTDDDNVTITSTSAQYNAIGLSAGSHIASVYVVDTAGNSATFYTNFTIAEKSSSISSSGSSSSSSSSGGGGGSGGGTTGEKYENVLVKEVESIFVIKGSHVSYEFTDEGNAISSVQFDSLKNSGSIQTIIEVVKDRSSFAKTDAPGQVYQQMNIWVGKSGFVRPENVEDLLITFKVEKSWLTENNIEADTVMLYKYADSSWNKLSTTVTGEDDEYVYFESETPGFSPFAIASESESESAGDDTLQSVVDDIAGSVAAEEQVSEVETTSNGFSTTGILLILGLLVAVLVGGYILYGKRN